MIDSLQGDLGIQIVSYFQSGIIGKVLWYVLLPLHYIGSEKGYLFLISPIYWVIHRSLGKRLLIYLLLGTIISGLFKIWWECPRPFHVNEGAIRYMMFTSEYGLPSGHTVFGTIFGMTIFNFIDKKWQRYLCVLFVFLMGISRMVHGMHFLQDVIVGWGIGLLVVYIGFQYDKVLAHFLNMYGLNVKRLYLYMLIFFLILTSVILQIEELNITLLSSLGGIIGGITGLLIERHKSVDCERDLNELRILRIITGIILLIVLFFILELITMLLGSSLLVDFGFVLHFLKYILLGFGVTYIIPYLLFKSKNVMLHLIRS